MRPRIYTYKITFIDTPYYYYGVHKEKRFNEYYMGSPKTHKWCWELYEPEKQILEFFEFSDEGWLEANLVEYSLIKPFYQTDKWCLNESCGGKISLEALSKSGLKNRKNRTGIFSQTPEQWSANGKKSAKLHKENGTALFGLTKEQRQETGRKMGLKNKENGTGIFAQTPEERSELGRRNGLKTKENGTGIFSLTAEQKSELGKKSASQKWICLETGYISNAGGLCCYQKKRGIDTSKRKRIS
jgi:hypothetical protein